MIKSIKSIKMIYNKGDRVFDKLKNMYCTINYLRDDSYEKEMRHKNPNHYYYYVIYDNGDFETYLSYIYLEKN